MRSSPHRRWLLGAPGLVLLAGLLSPAAAEEAAKPPASLEAPPAPAPDPAGLARAEPSVWVTSFLDATLTGQHCVVLGLSRDKGTGSCYEACFPGQDDCTERRRVVAVSACSPTARHQGTCLDPVVFQDPIGSADDPFEERSSRSLLTPLWRNLSHLYLSLWSGLAPRWTRDKDPVAVAMAKAGTSDFPSPSGLWARSVSDGRRVHALPDPDRWLSSARWVVPSPDGALDGAPFRAVRVLQPDGQPTSAPPMVLLKGRFAQRLVVERERVDADLMDADRETSAVFLQQIYPYEVARDQAALQVTDCHASLLPLACFSRPATRLDPFVFRLDASGGPTATEEQAQVQFRRFAELVGLRLLQQGRRDYLAIHTRVLAALVAMSSPPGLAGQATVGETTTINNSLPGQSDSRTVNAAAEVTVSGGGASRIDYAAIPIELVRDLLSELAPRSASACVASSVPGRLEELIELLDNEGLFIDASLFRGNRLLSEEEEDRLVEQLAALRGRPDEQIWDWLVNELVDPEGGREVFDKLRLQRVVEGECDEADTADTSLADATFFRLSVEARRSQILVRQVERALVERFSVTEATSPEDVEKASEQAWTSVLALHGPAPQPGRPGVLNVDPTAICTTSPRDVDAAKEPVFRPIQLDVLFVGESELAGAEALWGARGELPFLWVDDPSRTRPTVDRLAGMPGERALYRARWELWTGWHLLWGATPLGEGRSAVGLALRTAAICDDTVLAPAALVPTLVRAGLLEGRMRGPQPLTRGELVELRRAEGEAEERRISNDERLAQGTQAGQVMKDGGKRAVTIAGGAADDPSEATGRAAGATPAASKPPSDTEAEATPEAPEVLGEDTPLAVSAYLRELVLDGLHRMDGQATALVVAFDTTLRPSRDPSRKLRPRTPYLIRQERVPERGWLRTAAWMLELHPTTPPDQPLTPIVPGYDPTGSDDPDALHLRWARRLNTDFTLGGDLGMFPWRSVTTDCDQDYVGVVASCDHADLMNAEVGASSQAKLTNGLTLGLTSLGTTWWMDRPRLAVEYGAELQLDALPPGVAWFYESNPVAYAWTFQPRMGVVGGLRVAPDPRWLRRKPSPSADRVRLPWGVDGAGSRTHLGRFQAGARAGFALVPFTTDGLMYTVSADGWAAWSVRSTRSGWASLTPYQPNALLGPYVRWQYSHVWGDSTALYLETERALQVLVGLRVQARLGGQAALPEVQ